MYHDGSVCGPTGSSSKGDSRSLPKASHALHVISIRQLEIVPTWATCRIVGLGNCGTTANTRVSQFSATLKKSAAFVGLAETACWQSRCLRMAVPNQLQRFDFEISSPSIQPSEPGQAFVLSRLSQSNKPGQGITLDRSPSRETHANRD
jgi:hypothetical protein